MFLASKKVFPLLLLGMALSSSAWANIKVNLINQMDQPIRLQVLVHPNLENRIFRSFIDAFEVNLDTEDSYFMVLSSEWPTYQVHLRVLSIETGEDLVAPKVRVVTKRACFQSNVIFLEYSLLEKLQRLFSRAWRSPLIKTVFAPCACA